MAVKPLPFKAQKRGKKLSILLSVIFGLIFGGSLGAFIGLTVSNKKDQLISTVSSSATTLKDTGEGYVYATNDYKIVFSDYENNVISTIDITNDMPKSFDLGQISSIESISFSKETNHLFVVGQFKKSDVYKKYIFRCDKNPNTNSYFVNEACNSNFSYTISSGISTYEEHDGYLYAITSDSNMRVMNKFKADDLSISVEKFTLYSSSFYEEGNKYTNEFLKITNDVIYTVHFDENGYIYLVAKEGVIAFKKDSFSRISSAFKNIKSVTYNSIGKGENVDLNYDEYVFFYYCHESPRGAFSLGNECYFITKSLRLAHFNFSDLELGMPMDGSFPEVYETVIEGVTFWKSAPDNKPGLYFNETAKKFAVITALDTTITYVDVSDTNNIQILFTDEAESNITDVVISNDGNMIFYLCQNEFVTNDNSRMIKSKSVENVNYNFKVGKFTPKLLITLIVAAFLFLISLLCAIKPLFLENFILFLKNLKQNWVAYFFLVISLTLLGMFCYYPAVGSISMSFFHYENNSPVVWNNFQNYKDLFTDPQIWKAFGNMAIFLITDVITAIIPPLIFAFFLTVMKNKKISGLTRTLLFLPSVIPGITKMMIWQNGIYGEYGVINRVIQLFKGNPVVFFSGTNFDLWALVLMGFPYVGSYLVFYGALMNIPGSYYEAAELEGLNVWKRFATIDIPLIRPQIKYVVILTIIASVQNFGRTYMINSSLFTLRTPIHLMYDYINKGQYGLSSAIATVLFVLLLVFTIFNMKKQKTQLGDSI